MLEKSFDGSKTLKFAPNSQNCVSLEPQVIIGFLYKMYHLVYTLNMEIILCFTNAIKFLLISGTICVPSRKAAPT